MDFNMSTNPENAAAVVRAVISDGNDVANKIEAVIRENPDAEAYGFPAVNVHKIVSALRLNALLAEKMFEAGVDVQTRLVALAKKYNIPLD